MSPRVSFFLFLVLDAASLAALFWLISFHLELLDFISDDRSEIEYDSGTYYLLLSLILPLIHIGQLVSKYYEGSGVDKVFGVIIIPTFIFLLVAVNVLNFYSKRLLDDGGYEACVKLSSSGAGKRGEEWRYRLGGCDKG